MYKHQPAVFWAELKRAAIRMKRYPVQTVANLFASYTVFVFLAFGLKAMGDVSPQQMGNILIGYVMWSFATLVIMGTVVPIIQEMSIGILEQVYLSAVRPLAILTHRTAVGLLIELLQSAVLLALICVTFHISLSLPVLPVALILLLTGAGLYGLGLILAAAAVIYKQIGRAVQLLQLVLLFLTGAIIPLESLPTPVRALGYSLPLSLGIQATREVTESGVGLSQLVQGSTFIYLGLNSAAYLAVGVLLFLWSDRVARRQGLLGQY